METDKYFLNNMFLAWEERHFLMLHVFFLLGALCISHFFSPLCTIYRTSAPSPLTLFGLLRSMKQRFLCNNLFFGHFFAGLNFRTVELLPWQQKFLLGTLMAPSPTAVLPRWWSYSGAATLQHHQGVGPVGWTRHRVTDGPMGPGASALAAISPTLTQHDQAEADVQKQNAMLESEDAIVTRLTQGWELVGCRSSCISTGDMCDSFAPSPLMAFTF